MEQINALNELATALAKAQAKIQNPKLTREVKQNYQDKKGNWKEKSYKYAELTEVLSVIKSSLNENNLSVLQTTGFDGEQFGVITTLLHSSGQSIKSFYPLQLLEKPQDMGSQLTYARRYSLVAMFTLAAEEDDDGELAQNAEGKKDENKYGGKQNAKSSGSAGNIQNFDSYDEAGAWLNGKSDGHTTDKPSGDVDRKVSTKPSDIGSLKFSTGIHEKRTFKEALGIEQTSDYKWLRSIMSSRAKKVKLPLQYDQFIEYAESTGVRL